MVKLPIVTQKTLCISVANQVLSITFIDNLGKTVDEIISSFVHYKIEGLTQLHRVLI